MKSPRFVRVAVLGGDPASGGALGSPPRSAPKAPPAPRPTPPALAHVRGSTMRHPRALSATARRLGRTDAAARR